MKTHYENSSSAAAAQAAQRGHTQDHNTATGGDATITYPARPNRRNCIRGIAFGYWTFPSGGYVEIRCGGVLVFRMPVTVDGAGICDWVERRSAVNEAMTITLADGGQGVVGDINVQNYWQEG